VGEHVDANSKNVWAALSSSIKGIEDLFGEIHREFDASIKGKGKLIEPEKKLKAKYEELKT